MAGVGVASPALNAQLFGDRVDGLRRACSIALGMRDEESVAHWKFHWQREGGAGVAPRLEEWMRKDLRDRGPLCCPAL